ncbi:MAG: GNAT family N-acetyltransferase [Lachnospiraceae bacterium]|nr:GNAT family N-acetyltransferase [Lachnospiraceae bacterium]
MKGKEVHLRPIVSSDLALLNKWKNQEETYQYLGGGFLPVSVDIQKNWMEEMMDTTGSSKRFMIETSSHQAVGMAGLYGINWIHRNCELGIFLGEKEARGKGMGKDVIDVLERFALDFCNLRKIKVYVVEENQPAVRMYEKLGYSTAGKLIEERYIKGKYCSVLIMEKKLKFFEGGGVKASTPF